MKILQINRYHHRMGGSETVYFNTAKLLKKKGHDVSFFAMNYPNNLDSNEKKFFTKAFDFNSAGLNEKLNNFKNFFYNTNAQNCLEKLLSEIKPDVAHIHLFYGSLSSSILVALKKLKVPVVITAHDYRLICPSYLLLDGKSKICEKCEGHKFYNCVVNKCAKNSYGTSVIFSLESYYRNRFYPVTSYVDKVILVSKFSMEMHLQHKPELKNIAVQLYNFTPEPKKDKISTAKGDYFLYVGRLSSEKGILSLIDAFNARSKYRLIVAGDGPLYNEVLARKKENIECSGFVYGEELENLIRNSSFVIVPSECYETLGMSAVESLALGKPVIAAKIGGLPEVVTHQKNGLLFEPFSSQDILDKIDVGYRMDSEEYKRLSNNAIQIMEEFNEDVYYEKLINIYESAIEKKKHQQAS